MRREGGMWAGGLPGHQLRSRPRWAAWSVVRHPATVWALRASNERLADEGDLPDRRHP